MSDKLTVEEAKTRLAACGWKLASTYRDVSTNFYRCEIHHAGPPFRCEHIGPYDSPGRARAMAVERVEAMEAASG